MPRPPCPTAGAAAAALAAAGPGQQARHRPIERASCGLLWRRFAPAIAPAIARQAQMKHRAFADLAVAVDACAVAPDGDVVRDRQTLAGAATDFLGGEERLVDPMADILGDATTGIADTD